MLGVIYWALRTAMVGILLTSAAIYAFDSEFFGTFNQFLVVLLGVLFANAIGMTLKVVPGKIGPALQAGTWYTLGFLVTIHMFELFPIDWVVFFGLYIAVVALALSIVNLYLTFIMKKNNRSDKNYSNENK